MAQKLESKFQENLISILKLNKVDEEVFAIGVSGGADSIALAYLLDSWAKVVGKKIIALTVEHGLRPESASEAEYVANLMSLANIEHHILPWSGVKPKTGIEEAARIARYNLLEQFCLAHNIKYLMIAHHKVDQAETFLMRLQRGSGVDGLSAMSEISSLGKLEIIRPLLDFEPKDLKSYLKSKKIEWKEDSSNYNEDFLRVKVRNLMPYLHEKIGLSVDRIANTAKVLGRTKDYLEKQVDGFVKNNVKFIDNKIARISISSLQNQHEEMLFRIVSYLIKEIGDKTYIPRANDVQRLCDAIVDDSKIFKGRTLGGCEIINYNSSLWIIPELKQANVLGKKEWEDFIVQNPEYKNIKLPYKARKVIKNIKHIEF